MHDSMPQLSVQGTRGFAKALHYWRSSSKDKPPRVGFAPGLLLWEHDIEIDGNHMDEKIFIFIQGCLATGKTNT